MSTQETQIMTEINPHHEEKKNPGPSGSGEPGTGPNSPEVKEQRMALRKRYASHPVGRITALRGQSIGRPPEPKSVRRRCTMRDIHEKDPEIPYMKFEAAARDLVCSLMERQDRMNEAIFYKINHLTYRFEDLEQDRPASGGFS
jgi:hypothetical protein